MTSSVRSLNSSKDLALTGIQLDKGATSCPLRQVGAQDPLHAVILMTPLPTPCTCGLTDGPQPAPVVVRMYQPDPETPALHSKVLDIFPSPEQMATMLFDVMEALGWRETYMVYNKRSEFYSCFEAILNEAASREFPLWSQEIPVDKEDGDDLDAILSDVMTAGRMNSNVLLMTSADVVGIILGKAANMLLLTSQSRWIITSFDVRESDLQSARSSGALLTLLRPFPQSDLPWGRDLPDGQLSYRMRLALDAVRVVSSLSPDLETFSGFSGHVSFEFDSCGKRMNLTVFVHEYLHGKTKQNKPYFMKKPGKSGKVGSALYHGYMLDLLEMLASRLNFTWDLTGTGKASQSKMLETVKSGKYDMVLCPTAMRPNLHGKIEFSLPLVTRGYFLTTKKPDRLHDPRIFKFMKPFSGEVWLCFVAAAVGVSLVLAANGRLNPYEWARAAGRGEVSAEEADNLSLANSLWSTYGASVSQGQEFLPRSVAGRVIAGTWWFFILVIIASYTANLAAFLSHPSVDQTIRSLSDLAGQTDVPYGTFKGYSFYKFLKKSQEEPFKTLGRYLDKNSDEVLTNNTREAFERAAKGDFIFISAGTYEYEIFNKRCDMVILTDEYFYKYQVALPFRLGSPYRTEVNLALMDMAAAGQMDVLENRWFNKKNYNCYADSAPDDGVLGLDNLDGLFYYLMLGTAVAMLVSSLEWMSERVTCRAPGAVEHS
ncbi:PREDICTED: glutamate receptor 2-like [Branchiostoma belcheri]|uniref:Glutamate receptor 2-like n=1 Tax=Branchiostoma belcheri TaxID=7741 RepID=A0A6P5ATH1_BRABE|nr:PREDICTED: glutamate receptor 2-like [Branchiostoma belcheri]